MEMDCHLFAYLAGEPPLLHMSIYPCILQYSSLSTFIHGLLFPFFQTLHLSVFSFFHLKKIQRSNDIGYYLPSISPHDIYQFETFEPCSFLDFIDTLVAE
jgi:hypothetical protein